MLSVVRSRGPIELMVAVAGLWVLVVAGVTIPAYLRYDAPPEVLSTQEVGLELSEFAFSQSEVTVAPGTDLSFALHNVGNSQHNFGFSDGNVTERIKPGESDTFHAGVLENDRTFFCLIPGHRESGMEMTVKVTGG